MKIRAITPIRVTEEEVARRQDRYNRLAPNGWQIAVENTGDDAPRQLGSTEDLRRSEQAGVRAAKLGAGAGVDAVMPDCVLDPGLGELTQAVPQRVLGITRLSAGFLAALGVRFGVITRNQVIADEYSATIQRYGLGDAFAGAYVLDLGVDDIADTKLWSTRVEIAAGLARADGVTVLINGCSAVEVTDAGGGVVVVDPTALALQVLALGASTGVLGTASIP